jgi:hypothetical protein
MIKVIFCPQKGALRFMQVNDILYNEMVMIHPNYYLCYTKKIYDYNWRYVYDDLNNESLKYSSYYIPTDAIILKQNESTYENCFNREDIDDEFIKKLPQILGSARRRPRILCKEKTKFLVCNKCCVVKEWIKLDFF